MGFFMSDSTHRNRQPRLKFRGTGCQIAAACIVVCVLTGAPGVTASVTQNMADGAVALASMKFAEDPDSEAGAKLLRFALFLDPDHRRGLVLQAKIERNQPFKKIRLADDGKKYVDYLMRVIRGTDSRERKLLLYKVIEQIQPQDEDALFALTKAKNEGYDTRFEALLAAVKKGRTAKTSTPSEGSQPSPERASTKDRLEQIRVESLYISSNSPISAINTLNRAIAPHDLAILIRAERLPARISHYSSTTGAPYYSSDVDFNLQLDSSQRHMRGASVLSALKRICRLFSLSYTIQKKKIVITDRDDPEAVDDIGYVMNAKELFEAFDKNRLESIQKYRDKTIEISGTVTGIGKAMSRDYIHLADDKVRVLLGRDASEKKLRELKEDYEDAVGDDDDDDYYVYTTSHQKVIFTGQATCVGERASRIVLDDCTSFSWRQTYDSD